MTLLLTAAVLGAILLYMLAGAGTLRLARHWLPITEQDNLLLLIMVWPATLLTTLFVMYVSLLAKISGE